MTRNLSLSPTATPHLGQLSPLTSSPYHHHQLSPRGVSAGGAELKRVYTESSQGMDGVFALFVLCWLERCALVHSGELLVDISFRVWLCFLLMIPSIWRY